MRALTLIRPWELPIVHGAKPIENRSWRPWPGVIGTRIGIHAGQQFDVEAAALIRERWGAIASMISTPGVIVGSAIVAGYVWSRDGGGFDADAGRSMAEHPKRIAPPMERGHLAVIARAGERWFVDGSFGWVLVEPHAYREPVACSGAQGIWQVPDAVAEACAAQEQALGFEPRFER